MKATLGARPALVDSTVLDVPWREISGEIPSSFRIGLVPEDPRFPLQPPVKFALNEAVKRLQGHGHTIVPLEHDKCHVADATEVAWKMFMFDGETPKFVEASGEPFIPSVVYTHGMARDLDNQFATSLEQLDRLSQLALLRKQRSQIREDWREAWTNNKLDLVLSPSAQSTAVEHDRFGLPPYTTLTNVLDVGFRKVITKHVSADNKNSSLLRHTLPSRLRVRNGWYLRFKTRPAWPQM